MRTFEPQRSAKGTNDLLNRRVLFISYNAQPRTFYFTLAGFALFIVALLVTTLVEVPIVKQIMTWTVGTLPGNWQQLRDRWGAFLRIAGDLLLAAGDREDW